MPRGAIVRQSDGPRACLPTCTLAGKKSAPNRSALRQVRGEGASSFLRELGWREFSHHLLHHFPHLDQHPLREQFASFPWCEDRDGLRAWQIGQTGYPPVDAGMRQLWQTGWMHNRVRMVVGSFLVKDLLIDWRRGAEWFWDTLVDADLANNSMGWQWVAGCGADAHRFFASLIPYRRVKSLIKRARMSGAGSRISPGAVSLYPRTLART